MKFEPKYMLLGNKQLRFISLIAVLVLALAFLTYDIHKPFIGHHDWNGVWYGTIARNNLRYGLIQTKLGAVGGNNPGQIDNPRMFVTHYPPLFPLLLTGSIYLFGQTEAALRLVPIVFSLTAVIFIYLTAEKLFNQRVAYIASFLTVVLPMFIYFGKMPVHEPVLLATSIVSIYWYIIWFHSQKRRHYFFMLAVLTLSLLIGWPAYLLPLLFVLHYSLFKKHKRYGKHIVLLLLLPPIFFGMHLTHVKLLTGSFFGGGLLQTLSTRVSSSVTTQMYALTPLKILKNELLFVKAYFTSIVSLLMIVWLGLFLVSLIKRRRLTHVHGMVVLLFIFGIWYVVVFQEAAYIHDYLLYYLIPFAVIIGAQVIDTGARLFKHKTLQFIFVFLLILAVALERRSFVKALQSSDHSYKGYRLGVFINTKTHTNEVVYIGSHFYNQIFSPFITYYSHRQVHYGETIFDNNAPILSGIDRLIRPKAHDALDKESKEYLDLHYLRQENDDFIWYTMR